MSANTKRILISFLVSIVGLCATSFYFTKYYPSVQFHIDEKPLAKVEKLENSSRRKLAQHRTWQIVEFGDSLYSGESIKTSPDADISIRFLDSNTILNLEADSLITIKKNKGEISLNLIEGHLFVDSTQNDSAASVKLESKDGLIDLLKTSVTVSKEKNTDLNLNVITGRAKVIKADGQSAVIEFKKPSLIITEPVALSVIESQLPEMKIVWLSAEPNTNEKLVFKVGTKRSDLLEVKPSVLGTNKVNLPVKFGKNFVQLEIRSVDDNKVLQAASVRFLLQQKVSAVSEVTNVPAVEKVRATAQIVWNSEAEEVQNFVGDPELNLQWTLQNNDSVQKLNLKIFEDDKLILSEVLTADQTKFKAKLPKSGRYLASIEAVDTVDKRLAQSKIKSIVSEQLAYLASPEWTDAKPTSDADLNGVYLARWKPLDNIVEYSLELVNPSGKVIRTWSQKNNFVQLKNLLPGEYKLTLTTLDQFKRISPNKSVKIIRVADNSAIDAPKLKKMRFK